MSSTGRPLASPGKAWEHPVGCGRQRMFRGGQGRSWEDMAETGEALLEFCALVGIVTVFLGIVQWIAKGF